MDNRVGKDLKAEYPRRFVPEGADLGDAGQVEALHLALEKEEPKGRAGLSEWLLKWSELAAAVQEEAAVRYILMSCQTDDPEREKAYLHFVEQVDPIIRPLQDRLSRKLLNHPAVNELDAKRYHVLLRELRTQVEIFREANVPLLTEEEKLSQQYQKIVGAMTVHYDGQERTLPQMSKYLMGPDRAVRREAWELAAARRLQDKDELEEIFDAMIALRHRIATNAGLANYRDFSLKYRGRYDYGTAECEAFHQAVAKAVVPLYRKRHEVRRGRMKLDALRPWDLAADPLGRPALAPFEQVPQLIEGCRKIFNRLDPELGRGFEFMIAHDLLDLDSRKGKAPGGFSHALEEYRVPFIFTNAVGVDHDVYTMLHEYGHSYHTLVARDEPLNFYRHAPLEFCEVASMSLEFLGLDHLAEFYGPDEAARSREEKLEEVIWLFCWVAAIDSFQHWLYTHPGHTREERAAAWLANQARFGGAEDWSGYEQAHAHMWHRQLHLFQVPFYYIEYGIAEMGALQVWLAAKKDVGAALRAYRAGLSLGGSRTLPELFAAAGAKFDLGPETLIPLIEMVRGEIVPPQFELDGPAVRLFLA
jgi:oligoendopeptidase F